MFSGSTNGVELGDVLGPKGTPTPGTHWSGLSQDRLLVSDRVPPSLDGGEPFIIAYANNLNVGGLNQEKVQRAKDGAVQRLRSSGFGVHEEVDANTRVESLGFQIDGVQGLVTPIPHSWG
jgi:hypothetical protein